MRMLKSHKLRSYERRTKQIDKNVVELKLVRHCRALLRLHRNQKFYIRVYIRFSLSKGKHQKKPETLGRWTKPNKTQKKKKPLLRIVVLCFCCSSCCRWVCVLFFEERERGFAKIPLGNRKEPLFVSKWFWFQKRLWDRQNGHVGNSKGTVHMKNSNRLKTCSSRQWGVCT